MQIASKAFNVADFYSDCERYRQENKITLPSPTVSITQNLAVSLSTLPENTTCGVKRSKAIKQVLFQLLLLSPHFKAHPTFRKKLSSTALGQSIFSVPTCCSK